MLLDYIWILLALHVRSVLYPLSTRQDHLQEAARSVTAFPAITVQMWNFPEARGVINIHRIIEQCELKGTL